MFWLALNTRCDLGNLAIIFLARLIAWAVMSLNIIKQFVFFILSQYNLVLVELKQNSPSALDILNPYFWRQPKFLDQG